MTISREDVLRVAELAHLELTPEEIELYRGQLDEILAYIGKLEKLDVANVQPMAQVLFAAPGRPTIRNSVTTRWFRATLRTPSWRKPLTLPSPSSRSEGDREMSEYENER